MEFEKLYTVEDVAQITGLTLRTIRNYLKDGRLKGRRIGVQWRFTAEDIQALFDAPVPRTQEEEGQNDSQGNTPTVSSTATETVATTDTVAVASAALAEAAITAAELSSPTTQQAQSFLNRTRAPRSSACTVVDMPGVSEQEARFLFNRLQTLAAVYEDTPKRLELSYEYDENREQARYVFSGALESACAMLNLCEVQ